MVFRLPVVTTPTYPRHTGDRIQDTFGRKVSYLRLSLTDRCNYRCTYCMPEEVSFRPRADLLTFEEIVRLVRVFAGLGVRRVRLTGGEPTVRNQIVDLTRMVAEVVDEVVMTTNGHLLADLAGPLAEAGLRGVNVSIDTLDPARFAELTRRGDLARVVAGIDAARAAGLEVKLNAVALHGVNDPSRRAGSERGRLARSASLGGTSRDEPEPSGCDVDDVAALCAFAWDRGTTVRFIEHMPMSAGQLYAPERELSAAAIRAAVEAAYGPLAPSAPHQPHRGPSRYWHLVADPRREVGIISAMTEHFCDACNRLRLTATGELHACLGHDDAISLRDVVRAGGSDDDVRDAIAASVGAKRAGHEFQRSGVGGPTKHMVSIGG